MTIIFLTRRFYPQIGGVESHVLAVGKEMTNLGHKIIVISEDLNTGSNASPNSGKPEIIRGIEIRRIVVGRDDMYKKFRIWKELWKVRSIFSESEIVHCHDVFFWYLPFRFLYPTKKVYTTFHGYETKFPPTKKAISIRKLSEILSSGTICVGDYIKKWYYAKPDYIIYGGVDIANNISYAELLPGKKINIILIGRLENDIGIATYLASLKLLTKEKVKYNFQAIGEGNYEKKIKKFGKVSKFSADIGSTINKNDIVFCSSYLTMLESLIRRKIVIAIYNNKLKEDYLRNSPFGSYIYICKDAEEVALVVRSIQNYPWKSANMIENGYEWARKQTWGNVAKIYLKLWNV